MGFERQGCGAIGCGSVILSVSVKVCSSTLDRKPERSHRALLRLKLYARGFVCCQKREAPRAGQIEARSNTQLTALKKSRQRSAACRPQHHAACTAVAVSAGAGAISKRYRAAPAPTRRDLRVETQSDAGDWRERQELHTERDTKLSFHL